MNTVIHHCRKFTTHKPSLDIKPDNILFSDDTAPETIQKLLNESSLTVDGEFELYGMRYPIIRSQPVLHPFSWNDRPVVAELYSVRLVGFGRGYSTLIFHSIETYCCFSTVGCQWAHTATDG